MPEPWFKTALIYEVDVRTFFDSDGDGRGDFRGLTTKLDYIAGLGVNVLWLNPFFESPDRDGGYDTADYYAVDPSLGSLGDFAVFLEEAKSLGFRVIIELIANHTSDQHPWFQQALSSRDAPTRDYYIWVDEPPADSPERIVFTDDDRDPWTFHEPTGQYYLHRFYSHEPDLNHANPLVREEVFKILGLWLAMGVDGFRIDAAPYVGEKGASGDEFDDAHEYLKALRSYIAERDPHGVLMAEADVEVARLGDYLGDGDEMNLLLSFLGSETIFLALAEQSAEPLERMLDRLPTTHRRGTYANFLRNHDELDLEMLSEEDRQLVFDTFAPDPDMRIYGRGIRRRPAPMLEDDPAHIRLAQCLTFTLPGIPILRYGDEIGMGDDLSLPDRAPVRTPMQWSGGANGGFSSAPPGDLYHPVIDDGRFGAEQVNVADQWADPDSLLNWTTRLIRARREARSIGTGSWEVLPTNNRAVLGLRFRDDEDTVITFHNLSSEEQEMDASSYAHLAEQRVTFADTDYSKPLAEDPDHLLLSRYGYLWLRGRRSEPVW